MVSSAAVTHTFHLKARRNESACFLSWHPRVLFGAQLSNSAPLSSAMLILLGSWAFPLNFLWWCPTALETDLWRFDPASPSLFWADPAHLWSFIAILLSAHYSSGFLFHGSEHGFARYFKLISCRGSELPPAAGEPRLQIIRVNFLGVSLKIQSVPKLAQDVLPFFCILLELLWKLSLPCLFASVQSNLVE